MTLGSKIRKLDVFKKVPLQLSEGTNIGGFVSILTAATILGFIAIHLYLFTNPQYSTMIRPMSRDFRRKMRINVDITFPRLPCQIITIQQQDSVFSSNFQIDSVKKYRLDIDGIELEQMNKSTKSELQLQNPFQEYERIRSALKLKNGCRLKGSFQVNQVPGIFRFTLDQHIQILGMLMAEGLIAQLDLSHHIHTLSFGDPAYHDQILRKHPNSTINHLENCSKSFAKAQYSHYMHYHIDVVPTVYREGWSEVNTYQYVYVFNTVQTMELPALYFQYWIGGITLEVHCDREVWYEFVIKLCSVVGGTYAVASFLNNVLNRLAYGETKGYQLIQ